MAHRTAQPTVAVFLRLSVGIHTQLVATADELETSTTQVVREAVQAMLDTRKAEAARAAREAQSAALAGHLEIEAPAA